MNDRNKSAVLECCIGNVVEIQFKNGGRFYGTIYHGDFLRDNFGDRFNLTDAPYILLLSFNNDIKGGFIGFYKSAMKKCRVV